MKSNSSLPRPGAPQNVPAKSGKIDWIALISALGSIIIALLNKKKS